MADAAEFVVSMIDRVSAPAFKASQAVDNLNKQLKKTGTIGVKYTGSGPVPDVVKRLNKANLATYAKTRIGQPLASSIDGAVSRATSALFSFAKYSAIALGAAGTAAAVFAVKSTVHMAMFAEKTRLAFSLLTGNQAIGEQTFTRTIELSRQLGLDVEDTAHSMQKLLAQQFTPPEAEKWVQFGADLRAVGVSADALQRVMLDISHVKATGKLQMRNLNQFANAGVSAQLLMEEVGKAMGTNEAGAMAAMHKGKVTSAIALPALERAIMRKTHEHAAGEAGTMFANTTLTGLTDQLKNAPKLFFLRMADAAQGAIQKLKPLVDAIMKSIDQIQGDTFVRFIGVALEAVTKMVPLAMEFAKGFGEGFSSIVDAMSEIDPAKASMQTAHDLGKAIADAFGVALKVMKEIADMLIWFDQHRTVAETAAGALGITRLLGAGTVAKGLFGGGKLLMKGGKALGGLIGGIGGGTAAATAAETAAATTAATTAAGTAAAGTTAAAGGAVAAETAAAGAGTAGAAALAAGVATWAGTSVAAASVGAIAAAILPGLLALGAGIYWREEIAKFMLGKAPGQADHRGIDASDFPTTSPTPVLTGLQRAAATQQRPNTNVQLHTTVNVDSAGKDGAELGRDVGEHQRGVLEQFFQSQALEQGAM